MKLIFRVLALHSLGLLGACQTVPPGSGAGPTPTSAPPRPASSPSAEPAGPAAQPAHLTHSDDSGEVADASEPTETEPSAAADERELVYRISPEGPRIEVLGATFRPQAEAFSTDQGWGVRVSVEAESEALLTLSSPGGSELAFGGYVEKSSERRTINDARGAESTRQLAPGETIVLERSWPSQGEVGLSPGETLHLQIGLWGLGADAKSATPVRRFFVVKMTHSSGTPKVEIEPPPL